MFIFAIVCAQKKRWWIFIMADLKSNRELLDSVRPKGLPDEVQRIIGQIIDIAYSKPFKQSFGVRLAALFDLFVSCQYYNGLANKGWTYCPNGNPMLFYAYTNLCPHCLGSNKFVFTKGNKPESGQIGVATTEILCEMLVSCFRLKGREIEIHKASEPIDVIIYEPATQLMVISEIKAAPLFTIPLSLPCEKITEEIDGVLVDVKHNLCDNPFLHKSQPLLFFPTTDFHKERFFQLKIEWDNVYPFFFAIRELCLSDKEFLPFFFDFWEEAYSSYKDKIKSNPVFWLTNACGQPTPRPDNWPKRSSGGYETVSDAKTSVGMDRTDDIKKGIYQVLKLGAEYKPGYKNIKTALISNVHAVRHHDEYLNCIKDIVWTIDESREIRSWSEIDPKAPLYNLFDGIISFTESDIRDEEVTRLFSFQYDQQPHNS